MVQRALANYDEDVFRKWFGRDISDQPDINVKQRIRNTYNFMKGGY